MVRTLVSGVRLLATLTLVAAVVVVAASLLASAASAAPRDDVVGIDEPVVVVEDPTETPTAEPELAPVDDPGLAPGDRPDVVSDATFVAIPSVSPSPTRDPFDVEVGDIGDIDEVYDDPGTGDLLITSEVCDPIVPGQIDDMFCSPAPSSGYQAYLYAGTSNQNFTIAYQGALPVDLLDLPAGPYMLAAGPTPGGMQFKTICRVESAAGDLIQTLSGASYLHLSLGYDAVARCTVYLLPAGELPDELAPIESTDGPVELVIADYDCPAGTDPTLNYFGLIGRCPLSGRAGRWEARGAAGGYETGDAVADGTVAMTLTGGVWTVNTFYATGDYPPVLFCNVRDEFGNEPPQYAPFMTYQHGETGAVMALQQNMTWLCAAYFIPSTPGDGSDVIAITTTLHACPEGTTAPTTTACAAPLPGATVHLLFGTETIVATRQTDAAGEVAFAGPENLGAFGLAEEAPAGYVQAPSALCSVNGGAKTAYPVSPDGILDLGPLVGGDTVSCDWFNVADPGASASAAPDVEVAVEPAEVDGASVEIDGAQGGSADPATTGADDATPVAADDAAVERGDPATATPESGGILPLEADE